MPRGAREVREGPPGGGRRWLLTVGTKALVAATWAFRARAERESELRFARLARELDGLGAQPDLVGMAGRSSRDEHRHAQLCAALCEHYGGRPPTSPAHDHPATWPGLEPRDQALYEVVSFACIAETINAQLLAETLERADVPRIRRVVRRLLKDEVNHGRLGWAHLAAERAEGHGDFLAALLPRMLAGSVDPGLFDLGPEPVDAEAVAHGELPRVARQNVFRDALRQVVLPGFEALGLDCDPAVAWLDQLEHRLSALSALPRNKPVL